MLQFYTDDAVLLDGLAGLIGGSLAEGQSVAAIVDELPSKRPGKAAARARR